MLETERYNTGSESDNDDRPAGTGYSAGVAENPADGGQAAPESKEAGGSGRRLFRRSRRAATRPAGPPASGQDSGPGQAGGAAAPAAGPEDAAPAAGPREGAAAPSPPGPAPQAPVHQVPQLPAHPPVAAAAGPQAPPPQAAFQPPLVIFQPPDITLGARKPAPGGMSSSGDADGPAEDRPSDGAGQDEDGETGGPSGRRRRRGGRGHAKGRGAADAPVADGDEQAPGAPAEGEDDAARSGGPAAPDAAAGDETAAEPGAAPETAETTGRRRRRRRRSRDSAGVETPESDDPPNTVVHVRPAHAPAAEDGPDVKGVKGSTRLEAKRQRRREGRESGRRRPPIITESEFLARREAVERVMVVRQRGDRTQIAVLEDGILVEHYVDKASHQSYVGNVYLGRVQNVLPSMEAAFVDIGKGRNAVLYAGEVNFDASGLEGESKRIESALKSGQSILVQVTKDPIGHKGARLTSQVSLPGRYLVYVPGASMTGISRKLPDTERNRLKQILKQVMPEDAGVIVRTAAEGATEEELSRDVGRLAAQWEAIERKAKSASAPELLYSEPDLTIRVVRDIFNEDFTKLVIASDSEWDMVDEYVRYVAPNLAERLQRWNEDQDVFAAYRIDEQIAKALERKVWLPSGGSLVIDTTEAMTVIDVNTGKFTGQGGNLEQTVTRNNLEAAEEIVRQLRVRDVGGIIVIDFIDMVLESNRDLVLRRLLECLARDRTKHQVAEVTSLGLVQMTRKRVGSGLLEAFSAPCECCNGRGVIVSLEPVDHVSGSDHHHGRDGSSRAGAARGGAASREAARGEAARDEAARGEAGRDEAARGEAANDGGRGSASTGGPQSRSGDAVPSAGAATAAAVTVQPEQGGGGMPDDRAGNGPSAGAAAGPRQAPGGRRRRRAADGHGALGGPAGGDGHGGAQGHGGGAAGGAEAPGGEASGRGAAAAAGTPLEQEDGAGPDGSRQDAAGQDAAPPDSAREAQAAAG
jgi:ribonuclease E